MAATFLQALVETYATVSGAPTLWGEQVADSTTAYPRAELNHMGQQPYYAHDGTVEKETAKCQFVIWHTALAALETLCTTIKDALTPTSLSITGKTNRLWRTNYRVGIAQERTSDQQPVFIAFIEYDCEII